MATGGGASDNSGSLGAGITALSLMDAVKRSGYPFQAEVAHDLRSTLSNLGGRFFIQEEWVFVDSETEQARALDVWARVPLIGSGDQKTRGARFPPHLNMLIECKQSELPYVFFLRSELSGENLNFPEIAGMVDDRLQLFRVSSDRKPTGVSLKMSLHTALSSESLEFCNLPAPVAISFAKVLRKGSKLELTGEDTYRAITMPLGKAADYLKSSYDVQQADQVRLNFVVCIAVLKAPMVGVYLHNGKQMLIDTPWIRVMRMEPHDKGKGEVNRANATIRYFDVIHFDYFKQYVKVLMRDMSEFGKRCIDNWEVIKSGVGLELKGRQLEPLPPEYNNLIEQNSSNLILTMHASSADYAIPDNLAEGEIVRLIPPALLSMRSD
jgi:hypothetical protein